MSDFKLLAIRPLINCDEKYLKNLTTGLIYPFYSDYRFLDKNGEDVSDDQDIYQIKVRHTAPERLYNVQTADGTELKINISAVAGKNGSGKSSLIELLFAVIYIFSADNQLLETELTTPDTAGNIREDIRDIKIDLTSLWADKNDAYEQLRLKYPATDIPENELEKHFTLSKNEIYLNDRLRELNKKLTNLPLRRQRLEVFRERLKAEVYFEIDESYYLIRCNTDDHKSPISSILRFNKQGSEPEVIDQQEAQIYLKDLLFYTISINYSHHGLNAKVLGDWINSLFHKNDGYRTPLVINPMRTKGNFDINREMSLVKYRLLSNLLVQKYHDKKRPLQITETLVVEKIIFRLNTEKMAAMKSLLSSGENNVTGNERAYDLISELMTLIDNSLPMAMSLHQPLLLKDDLFNYIIRKVDRITELYPGFEHGFKARNEASKPENLNFLQSLIDDGTHITNKLLQALHFLRYISLNGWEKLQSYLLKFQHNDGHVLMEFAPDRLIDWMNLENAGEVVQKLPPSIFDIDFALINPLTQERSRFTDLSSGEQHLIHVIQSVIYHINNLQSAHLSKVPRLTYHSVNVIYDEIELYFHPEYQRRLVSELLQAFSNLYLKDVDGIKAINVQLLTHSPFLLSDIPDNNILLLDLQEGTGRSVIKRANKTFAANINDLLADNFFLEESLMGKFAEQQINKLIDKVKNKIPLNEEDNLLIKKIGDDYLRVSIREFIKAV